MSAYDIHIKGGVIVDGSGMPRYRSDLWIKDGVIAQIGGLPEGESAQVIDAEGCYVVPGFIDLHTHYDAQIFWDPYCSISGWHGVTSVALGNCGFGFAPVKPEGRERAMQTLTRTEAIPFDSMVAGVQDKWDWETVPQYLDTLARQPMGVNTVQFVSTVCLMIYVMGLEAAKTRPATSAEREEMKRLLHEAMDAGACGFSFQRMGPNSAQTDVDGTPMVTDTMADEDLFALAEVLRERNEGFIQCTQVTSADPNDPADAAAKEELARIAGRPVLDNIVPLSDKNPQVHEERLAWIARCQAEGKPVFGQASTLRSDTIVQLEHWNLYDMAPAWKEATTGTREEKIKKMADPELRTRIKADTEKKGTTFRARLRNVGGPIEELIVKGVNGQPELEKYLNRGIAEIGAEEGKHYIDVMLDIVLATDLKAEFMGKGRNYNAAHMAAQINDSPYTFPGISDGGAHTKFFIGGNWTTDFLRWLVRDEGLITLEEAHYRLSALPAQAGGFIGRGVLREGAPADVVVYNLEELDCYPDVIGEVATDLPAGEWRRIQHAKGYRSTIVNGVETFANGVCTGATPGMLIRHGPAGRRQRRQSGQ